MARSRALLVAVAAAALLAAVGCDRRPPEQRRATPTADGLAATVNAVGIPYDRVIVIRHAGRLLALRAACASQLGDRIAYSWHLADGDGRFPDPSRCEQGAGEAVEQPFTGRLSLPGRLVLEWSRGSTAFGWLYWPEHAGADYAVYSRPFAEVADLADGPHGGRWLTRDMFRP